MSNETLVWLAPTLVSLAVGFYVLGQWREMLRNNKLALERVFKTLRRHEEILQTLRDVLVHEGLLLTRDTQAGADGRGVRVPKD